MRHAVVTGAGSGVGRAAARLLASRGARVTLLGRDAGKLERAAAALDGAGYVIADVRDEAAVAVAFAAARAARGPVAILVNSAGVSPSAPLIKTSRADWNETLAVNLTGAFACMQAVLPDMIAAGWGRIVNVASTAGRKGYAYVAAYCASKHGLIGLTRAAALETATAGVTVNAVCPGFVDTDMTAQSIARIVEKTALDAEGARARLAANNPQGRLIAPEEVAAAIAWLCSDDAASVNGAALDVAGGEA